MSDLNPSTGLEGAISPGALISLFDHSQVFYIGHFEVSVVVDIFQVKIIFVGSHNIVAERFHSTVEVDRDF